MAGFEVITEGRESPLQIWPPRQNLLLLAKELIDRRSMASLFQARVPKLCPDPAFLTFLAVVAECGMSNLQIPRVAWEFQSPSLHRPNFSSYL
jgi:hypothetical protein